MLHPPVFASHPEFYRAPSLAAPRLLSTPPFFQPTPDKPLLPPPHNGTLLSSSPDGYVYRVPLTPHALNQSDLLAWGCDDADVLRQRATATTLWVYLDGSAGRGGYGSAATIYLPTSGTLTLCLPSPFQSFGGAEFWAAIMFLRWAHDSLPHSEIFVLGDNKHVVDLFSPLAPPPPSPSSTTDCTSSWALKSTLHDLPGHIRLRAAWIKGHAGFPGNECSDSYSKWNPSPT